MRSFFVISCTVFISGTGLESGRSQVDGVAGLKVFFLVCYLASYFILSIVIIVISPICQIPFLKSFSFLLILEA